MSGDRKCVQKKKTLAPEAFEVGVQTADGDLVRVVP